MVCAASSCIVVKPPCNLLLILRLLDGYSASWDFQWHCFHQSAPRQPEGRQEFTLAWRIKLINRAVCSYAFLSVSSFNKKGNDNYLVHGIILCKRFKKTQFSTYDDLSGRFACAVEKIKPACVPYSHVIAFCVRLEYDIRKALIWFRRISWMVLQATMVFRLWYYRTVLNQRLQMHGKVN